MDSECGAVACNNNENKKQHWTDEEVERLVLYRNCFYRKNGNGNWTKIQKLMPYKTLDSLKHKIMRIPEDLKRDIINKGRTLMHSIQQHNNLPLPQDFQEERPL